MASCLARRGSFCAKTHRHPAWRCARLARRTAVRYNAAAAGARSLHQSPHRRRPSAVTPRRRPRQNCPQDAIKPMGLGILIADQHRKHRHCCTFALELHRTDCRHTAPSRRAPCEFGHRSELGRVRSWCGLGVGFESGGQVHGIADASASRAGIPKTLWRRHHYHGAFSCRGWPAG
jgi:hypothetical protein